MFLIIVISILFSKYTRDLCNFISEFFSLGTDIVVVMVYALHILVLLIPCFYLVNNLRVVMYAVDVSSKKPEGRGDQDTIRFYQTMNPLIVAGGIDLALVVVIPDDFDPLWELILGSAILAVLIAYQCWRFAKGKRSKPMEIEKETEAEQNLQPEQDS